MRRFLVTILLFALPLEAYYPSWCCESEGSRERFPRHEACCRQGRNRGCCGSSGENTEQAPCKTNQSCYSCCDYGAIEISADALYWRPTRPGEPVWYTEADVDTIGSQQIFELVPDYDWGARLYGAYIFPNRCWFLRGGYNYVRVTSLAENLDRVIIVPALDIGNDVNIDEAIAQRTFYFQTAELYGGCVFYKCGRSSLYAFGGGRWVDIYEKNKTDASGLNQAMERVDGSTSMRYRIQGGGPQVGIGANCCFTSGLQGVTRLSAIALAAQRQTDITVRGPDAVYDDGRFTAEFPSSWGIVPGIDFSVGLRLTVGCCNVYLSGELGWETQLYFEAVRTAPLETAAPLVIYSNTGFSGPYGGFRIQF